MKRDEFYEERGLDRIIAISDCVFAFSLTFLALDLAVPDLGSEQSNLLINALLGESARFIYFFLTFIITGAYWASHHRIFRFVKRYDGILMRLNMVFLLFITLMPFITKLINEHGHTQVAVIIAATGYAIPGFLLGLIWHYSTKNYRLIDRNVSSEFARMTTLKNYVNPLIFIGSIPFSFIDPSYTLYCWLLLFPVGLLLNHLFPVIIEED